MRSTFEDILIEGRAEQSLAATDPRHLVRLLEVQAMIAAISATFSNGDDGTNGQTPYFAFASDASGTDFSLTPDVGLGYIAFKLSATALTSAGDFAGLWKKITGADGEEGDEGPAGQTPYFAFASDASGTDFSLTPGSGLGYIAFKLSATALTEAGDFTGLWTKFVGADGEDGDDGDDGDDGANAFLYVGYATDASGSGFSLTPSDSLQYIAIKTTTTAIVSPAVGDFTGLWKKYGSNVISVDGASALTLTAGVLSLHAASANTASYLVQRDASGNFAGGQITATTFNVGGSATITFASGAVTVNQPLKATALSIGTLSGVLKAATGVVAGSADTNDLTEGSVNLATPTGNAYFSRARVLATPLTGLSSTNAILAADTILAAFGKLDALQILTGYVSGAGTVGATDTILAAIQKLNGNQAVTAAAVAALNLTNPTFTGTVTLTQTVVTSGSPNLLVLTGAAHTTLAGGVEASDVNFNFARTVQFQTGALALQRAVRVAAPTYAFAGASTVTIAATVGITGPPVAGTNATITTAAALKIAAGAVGSGTTSAYGLYVDAPTGASNNYAAAFNTGDVLVNAGWLRVATSYGLKVNSVQVVTGRQTGWTAATGTPTRTTFATSSVTLPNLAERVKALIDDLISHGLIGT